MMFRLAVLRRQVVALTVAAALWGVAVSGTKYALGGFDPVTLLSVELLAGAGVLWAALLVRGYRPPRSWWLPVLLGLLEPSLAYLGDTFGLSLTSAVHGAAINGLIGASVLYFASADHRDPGRGGISPFPPGPCSGMISSWEMSIWRRRRPGSDRSTATAGRARRVR